VSNFVRQETNSVGAAAPPRLRDAVYRHIAGFKSGCGERIQGVDNPCDLSPDPRKELKDVRCTCGALVCFAKPDIGDRLPFGIVPGGRPGASGSGAENGGTSHKQPGRPFHDAQDEGLQVMQILAGVVSGFLPVRGSSRLLSGLRD
jgi:hypothetical protein